MKIDWQKDQCSWVARIGDVTLSAVPDRTSHFGTKAARGTKWRACVSHWDAPTRTASRFGRDVYMQLCNTAKDAIKLAEQVYRDERAFREPERQLQADTELDAELIKAAAAMIREGLA